MNSMVEPDTMGQMIGPEVSLAPKYSNYLFFIIRMIKILRHIGQKIQTHSRADNKVE